MALLKEVAGTKVYEQRRAESLRIMSETDSKRQKINELLDYIDSRLTELEEEKEELKEFQDKDKERRCLEYALYSRELEEVGKALEEIELNVGYPLPDAQATARAASLLSQILPPQCVVRCPELEASDYPDDVDDDPYEGLDDFGHGASDDGSEGSVLSDTTAPIQADDTRGNDSLHWLSLEYWQMEEWIERNADVRSLVCDMHASLPHSVRVA